jgi:hypothetical protein
MSRASFLVLGLCLVLVSSASAQTLSVEKFVLSGGGGTSTNSQFAVRGTIGQPAAGTEMVSGQFGMRSGFWSSVTVLQTPGAPLLSILKQAGTITLSWPAESTGFILEATPVLAPPISWQPVSGVTSNAVTLPSTPGMRFFRLRHP